MENFYNSLVTLNRTLQIRIGVDSTTWWSHANFCSYYKRIRIPCFVQTEEHIWMNQGTTSVGVKEREPAFLFPLPPHASSLESSKQDSSVWMKQGIHFHYKNISRIYKSRDPRQVPREYHYSRWDEHRMPKYRVEPTLWSIKADHKIETPVIPIPDFTSIQMD